jgi:cytochrome b561
MDPTSFVSPHERRTLAKRTRIVAGWILVAVFGFMMFLVLPGIRGGSSQDFEIFGLFGVIGVAFMALGLYRLATGEDDPEPLPPGPSERW